jgi:rhomboid protease GluP
VEPAHQYRRSVRRLLNRCYRAAQKLPAVTGALLAMMAVVFVLETLAGGASNADMLIAFGASLRSYFFNGEWWRLVMPMFIHLSIAHLMLNAAALFIFGPPLEKVYGGRRFALIYLGSGMSGSVASTMLSTQLEAGASGAIMGICGALAVTGYAHPWALSAEFRPKCREQMLGAIAVTLALGVVIPHIDNFAHVGGLVAGAVMAFVFNPSQDSRRELRRLGWSLTLPLAIVCFSITSAVNYYGLCQQILALETSGSRLLTERHFQAATSNFLEAQHFAQQAITVTGCNDPNYIAEAHSAAIDAAAAERAGSVRTRPHGNRP